MLELFLEVDGSIVAHARVVRVRVARGRVRVAFGPAARADHEAGVRRVLVLHPLVVHGDLQVLPRPGLGLVDVDSGLAATHHEFASSGYLQGARAAHPGQPKWVSRITATG